MVVHEVNFVTIKNAELMFVSQSFQWSANPKQTQLVSPAEMYYVFNVFNSS